jgi:glycosyltransferase involved in cell wall biosynthesis
MKLLVFGHRLEVGGTQVNSIELAAALRDLHGYEIVYFAAPGPMVKLVEQKGLHFVPAPDADQAPSVSRVRALDTVVRRERPDLIHAWDWWQCLDAYYGAHLLMRIPMLVSVMTMELHRILPTAVPTTLGTPKLLDEARSSGRHSLELLLPPVDVHYNKPGIVDPLPFRERYRIRDNEITLVTVSRVVESLKSESLVRTIEAIRVLGRELRTRLIIVGDGNARQRIDSLAREVNAELQRDAVVLTGALIDPREAYAAADIVVGMGGSALRGMAFEKPVIIVGERGFSAAFKPTTAQWFYYHGIYGLGDGNITPDRLISDIRGLLRERDSFATLGRFSREFVIKHFSLEQVSTRLANFCETAVAQLPSVTAGAADGLRTAALWSYAKALPRPVRRRLKALGNLFNLDRPITSRSEIQSDHPGLFTLDKDLV